MSPAQLSQHANDPLAGQAQMALRADLRRFALEHLPEAMVPSRFIVLRQLPKLPNGKVDRKQLPAPAFADPADAAAGGRVEPRTPEEARLAQIWCDLLNVGQVGVEERFFAVGGNSLSAVLMMVRIRETFGISLGLRSLFDHPTIAGLARLLGAAREGLDLPPPSDRSITVEALLAESALPEDVRPDPDARPAAAAPYDRLLLTGGTGYTGAFILRELLERSGAQVHVLVRADDARQAWRRVKENLQGYGLWRDDYGPRVLGVPGDIARPYLGLTPETYFALAEQVQMIVHNAALSNFAQPYAFLKPANVLGTLEVLRLAGRRQVKPVHFVSSLAVFPVRKGPRQFDEAPLTSPENVLGGYPQSKWVADRLVAQAHARGLPTVIYRPGQLCGAQASGACSTDTFLNAAIKGCIQLEAELAFDVPVEMVPVDHCAAAVAHIALGGGHHGEQFHLKGAREMRWQDVVGLIRDCGYPLRPLPYADWFAEFVAGAEAGTPNELARYMALFSKTGPADDLGEIGSGTSFGDDRLQAALRGSGIRARVLDASFMRLCLDYFVQTGYLPAAPRALP